MELLNVFDQKTLDSVLGRLDKLTPTTQPLWGKMNAPQMLAHLNVSYELDAGKIESKPPFLVKALLKLFLKPMVVGEKPYKKNSGTAPVFLIKSDKDFETEKTKFINFVKAVQSKGAAFYEGRENGSFGKLTAKEWSNLFYKHLNHHFTQFGI